MSFFPKYFCRNIHDVRTFQTRLLWLYATDKNIINNEMSKQKKSNKSKTTKQSNKLYDSERTSYLKDLLDNEKNDLNVRNISSTSNKLSTKVTTLKKYNRYYDNKCTSYLKDLQDNERNDHNGKNMTCSSNKLSTNVTNCSSTHFIPDGKDNKLLQCNNASNSVENLTDVNTKHNFRLLSLAEKKRKRENTLNIDAKVVLQKKINRKVEHNISKASSNDEWLSVNNCDKTSSTCNDIIKDIHHLTENSIKDPNRVLKQNKESNFINNTHLVRNMNQVQLQRSFSDTTLQNNWCLNPNMNFFTYEPICQVPVTQFVYHKKNKINYKKRTLSVNDISSLSNNYLDNVRTETDRLKNLRKWQNSELGDSLQGSNVSTTQIGFIFTLMSYNVLAQILLSEHSYLYRKNDPRALFWEHRKWALMREIREHDADILCLQEVEKTHLDSFYSQFHDIGYRGIFKQRTGIRIDGCALYYKYEKFDLIEYTTVEYYQPHIEILDRENVAIIARFSVKDSPEKQFVVATTHLLYNPKRQDIRLAQTQILLAEVDRLAFESFDIDGKPVYLPIIITGDFNLEPFTPVYELLVKGKFQYEGLAPRTLKAPETSRSGMYTHKSLLPKYLRITDNCQHADIVKQRYEGKQKLNRYDELNIIKLQHSERSVNTPNTITKSHQVLNKTKEKHLFSSGTLTHGLNLKSVYNHFSPDGDVEATTNQNEWITVDYIFYSLVEDKNDNSNREGKLQLVSRYEIPSSNDCKKFPMLPNLVLGSDHLALLAKFLLK